MGVCHRLIASAYLDRNHPQRIDVCFLAEVDFPAQDLRCGPSYGMVLMTERDGFYVRNDGGEAEVCDTRAACIVDENAWLGHWSVG